MRSTRRWTVLGLLLAVVMAAPWALAQRTGGSFGGSHFSSGGGSFGGGGGSYGGGYSGGYHSYGGGYGSYGGGGGGSSPGEACCIIFLFITIVIVGKVVQSRQQNMVGMMNSLGGDAPIRRGVVGGYVPETNALGAVAIAFDATARAQIQAEIEQIAQASHMETSEGMNTAARAVSDILAQHLDAAYLTHHAVTEGLDMASAEQRFKAAVDQERGRYLVETLRADAGGVRKVAAPRSNARVEEGGGFVVVTVLAARRGRLTGFVPATSREALARDIQILLVGPGALQAMEIVWQPSDPNDVMSSAEMAVVFPTLRPLSPDARVGRRACAYCKSVYAAELGRCPNCGAPAA